MPTLGRSRSKMLRDGLLKRKTKIFLSGGRKKLFIKQWDTYLSTSPGFNTGISLVGTSPTPSGNYTIPQALTRPKKCEPLTYGQICLLRTAAVRKGDELMVRYTDIARFTGTKGSEIGALTEPSIEFIVGIACFQVRSDAKTAASANWLIPILRSLQGVVDLTDLNERNFASAVGQRFGRLKRLILQDGDSRSKCFHSKRKFVVTTLEQAGISEGIAADLVGHEKPNITYNVYSNGPSVAQLGHATRALDGAQ